MTATKHDYAKLSNGIKLHYAYKGDNSGRLILFVHGFPEFWYEWQHQLEEFGRDHYAVAPDLRGFNLSDQPKEVEKYRAKHLVEDLRLLIKHLGHSRCILVAHDWGGAIAWNLACFHPDLVEKLVIINSPHPALFARDLTHNAAQIQASAYMNLLRRPDAERIMGEDDFARMPKFISGAHQSVDWFTPDVEARYRECWQRGLTGGLNLYRASPLFPATDTEPGATTVTFPKQMVTVRVPTLVIWGMRDEALLPSQLDGLDEYIPDLRLERIEEGTHWLVHEQPERVNRLIRTFIG
jgi:pimeloyl-ACP methyl ester carboxylesterase